jgi:hypothetical protein
MGMCDEDFRCAAIIMMINNTHSHSHIEGPMGMSSSRESHAYATRAFCSVLFCVAITRPPSQHDMVLRRQPHGNLFPCPPGLTTTSVNIHPLREMGPLPTRSRSIGLLKVCDVMCPMMSILRCPCLPSRHPRSPRRWCRTDKPHHCSQILIYNTIPLYTTLGSPPNQLRKGE